MYINIYLDIQKLHFFWSGLSERPKIEQLLIWPSVNHIWNDQKYNAKWRRKDAKDQLFDTKTVSLNPSLLSQKWFLGPRPKIHKDRKLCISRTVQICICICICILIYIYILYTYMHQSMEAIWSLFVNFCEISVAFRNSFSEVKPLRIAGHKATKEDISEAN